MSASAASPRLRRRGTFATTTSATSARRKATTRWRRRLIRSGRRMFGKVAVIHDWLTGMRGGELVLEAILDLVPEAELFTLFHFPGSVSPAIESRTIHTSALQPVATRVSNYRTLLPFFPRGVKQGDLSGFDLIVSSSHAVAKGIEGRGKPHVCYCHTPMRYIWDRFDDYFPRGLKRTLARPFAARLRMRSRTKVELATKRVTPFDAATSHFRSRAANGRARVRFRPRGK